MNYYALLGVPYDAAPQDIKAAYYAISKKSHPDLLPLDLPEGDRLQRVEHYKQITLAYGVLIDPEQRQVYNRRYCYREVSRKTPQASGSQNNSKNYDSDPLLKFHRRDLELAHIQCAKILGERQRLSSRMYDYKLADIERGFKAQLFELGYSGKVETIVPWQQRALIALLGGVCCVGGWVLLFFGSIGLMVVTSFILQGLGGWLFILACQMTVDSSAKATQARKYYHHYQRQITKIKRQQENCLQQIRVEMETKYAMFHDLPATFLTQHFFNTLSEEDRMLLKAALFWRQYRSGFEQS